MCGTGDAFGDHGRSDDGRYERPRRYRTTEFVDDDDEFGQPVSRAAVFLVDVQAEQVVAVRAGRLFDPRSGTMLTNQVIVISGDRIVDVGPSAAIPAGARTVDLSRVTVLPGLIDTHLHVMDGSPLIAPGGPGVGPNGPGPVGLNQPLQYRELEALVNAQRDLNAGFTTVVDLMSHGGWYGTADLRNAINTGVVQGPRMQVAGPGIVNTNKANIAFPLLGRQEISNLGAQIANSPWGVREAVREHAHYGVDWIKIYSTEQYTLNANGTMVNTPTFTLEETQAIVDEAHRKGLKVACHAYGGEGLRNCIAAGVDVPTHAVDLDDASLKMLVDKRLPLTVTMFDLSMEDAQEFKRFGNSRWRMMEKSFKKALADGVRKVHMIDGRLRHSLLLEIYTDRGVGTEIVLGAPAPTKAP